MSTNYDRDFWTGPDVDEATPEAIEAVVTGAMGTRCSRCGKETGTRTMSIFNTDMLCMACLAKEEKHPQYQEAAAAELAAVRRGNYNFPGLGKPADL